jgi:hypothetical protein
MKQTRLPVYAIKQSIYLDFYGLHPFLGQFLKSTISSFVSVGFFFCKNGGDGSSFCTIEQRTLKNVNNNFNTNIYFYSETFVGQSPNLYINVVHFLNTSVE